jgi:hypothetical protein
MLHLGGNPLIRTIRIRPPSPKCDTCGPNATIKVDTYDYDEFCAGPTDTANAEGVTLGGPGERINVQVSSVRCVAQMSTDSQDLAQLFEKGKTLVIDTRPEIEYGICSIPNTTSKHSRSLLLSRLLLTIRHPPQPDTIVPRDDTCRRGIGVHLQKGKRFPVGCRCSAQETRRPTEARIPSAGCSRWAHSLGEGSR